MNRRRTGAPQRSGVGWVRVRREVIQEALLVAADSLADSHVVMPDAPDVDPRLDDSGRPVGQDRHVAADHEAWLGNRDRFVPQVFEPGGRRLQRA